MTSPFTPAQQALVDLARETDGRVVGAYVHHGRGADEGRMLLVIQMQDADRPATAKVVAALRRHREAAGDDTQFIVLNTTSPKWVEEMPKGWPP